MSTMLRIGIAGAGWVSEHHLDAWATQSHRARVVAIADPAIAAAESRARRYDIPEVYASPDEMLDDARLDAIDVAAPREAHAPICRAAAARGVAILCQKPLAPTLAEAEQLVAEVAGRVPFMVHENWRFRPHYRRIGEWLRDDAIGRIRTVQLRVFTSGLLPDGNGDLPALVRQPMLASLERMLLMEVLIHHVDTLRFLLGPLSLLGAVLGRSCAHIRGEDRATLLLRTANGAAVVLAGDFMAYGYPPDQRDHLEMFGEDGAITLAGAELRMSGKRPERLTPDLAANYKVSYVGAISHFLDGLQHGTAFETAPEDNLETLRIVEAAYAVAR